MPAENCSEQQAENANCEMRIAEWQPSTPLLAKKSPAGREIKVIVASPSKISADAMSKFAKKLTKHLRASRGWSAVSASVHSMQIAELPPLGTPQQSKGNLTAWIAE
ncbi:MAG TPA: hypothetical protein VHS80_11945 [Chthoniobacterales bacterium]|nr:hypothetical protein [Chthoniobacterales bacterium]